MDDLETSIDPENNSIIGHMLLIVQIMIAAALVIVAIALILLWLTSVVLSLMPNNGLMPWISSGVSALGLLFIFLAAIPGVPGIIWVSGLANRVASPWSRILKLTAWIGKAGFKAGTLFAILALLSLFFR